jgi:glycosyltransferase involved in cell wall biosynthesis
LPNDAPRFTVLTPTFNRAGTLARAYHSVAAQRCRDFEWLVVDDGSTDATAALVASWQEDAAFPIRYVYRENGHKKAALNTGFRHARGEFTVILDSDDELTPDALAIFAAAWESIPPARRALFSGVRALCVGRDGLVVGDPFPTSPFDASSNELLYRYRIGGEKLSCDRTALLRRFPFPEDVHGLVPEQVLWSQLSQRHRCRCVNEAVRIYHDSTDSLSRRLTSYRYAGDVDGLAFAYSFVLDHDWRWFPASPKILIKVAANRTRFLRHLRDAGSERRYPLATPAARLIALAFGWIGHLLYRRDRRRSPPQLD